MPEELVFSYDAKIEQEIKKACEIFEKFVSKSFHTYLNKIKHINNNSDFKKSQIKSS